MGIVGKTGVVSERKEEGKRSAAQCLAAAVKKRELRQEVKYGEVCSDEALWGSE